MSEAELLEKLEAMPMEDYRSLGIKLSEQMKEGKVNIEDKALDSSLDVQKVWSDRLIGASAADYGKLLAIISNDELPTVAADTVRDLLEWPMEYVEGNQKYFSHLGSKGGSTAFILNDALYAENHDGDQVEVVILIGELNPWKGLLIRRNLNSFESKLLGSSKYREQVQEELLR